MQANGSELRLGLTTVTGPVPFVAVLGVHRQNDLSPFWRFLACTHRMTCHLCLAAQGTNLSAITPKTRTAHLSENRKKESWFAGVPKGSRSITRFEKSARSRRSTLFAPVDAVRAIVYPGRRWE